METGYLTLPSSPHWHEVCYMNEDCQPDARCAWEKQEEFKACLCEMIDSQSGFPAACRGSKRSAMDDHHDEEETASASHEFSDLEFAVHSKRARLGPAEWLQVPVVALAARCEDEGSRALAA